MRKIQWIAFLMVGVLSACGGQNPYPTNINYVKASPPPSPAPVKEKTQQALPYSLDVPSKFDFQEGVSGAFTVQAKVPSPGIAIVSIDGLPNGATFDNQTKEISWKPSLDAGHDPKNPKAFYKEYSLSISVQSDKDSVSVVQKKVSLFVWNVPKPLSVQCFDSTGALATTMPTLSEGTPVSLEFAVQSPDFPTGPFNFRIDSLPIGATLTPKAQDPTRFIFKFLPDFHTVNMQSSSDTVGHYVDLVFHGTAESPRATNVSEDFTLRVYDVRRDPIFQMPEHVTMNYGGSFSIIAEDPNGEVAPSVALTESAPFGTVTLTDASSDAAASVLNPKTIKTVSWMNIPDSAIGTSQDLSFSICSFDALGQQNQCVQKTMTVFFEGKPRLDPQFDRTQWPETETKSMMIGDRQEFSIPATDLNHDGSVFVKVEPAIMNDEVSYQNGKLIVDAKTSGFKIFTLMGVNKAQIVSRESFSLRVLPKEWSKSLLLGETLKDPEIQATLPLFQNAQILNPSISPLSDEMLANRSLLFVTTSAIKSGLQAPAEIGSVMGKMQRMIISSPVMSKIPRFSFPDDLTIVGRYSDLTLVNKPNLNTLSLASQDSTVFVPAQHSVRLQQSLTSESGSPLIFSVRPQGACEVLLSLTDAISNFPVAVACQSPNGAKTLFVGFEWADMGFDKSESALSAQWLQAFVESNSFQVMQKDNLK